MKRDSADAQLRAVVKQAFAQASTGASVDEDTISIVTACAGLLACVGYADRRLSRDELDRTERLLSSVGGLDARGRQAIVAALEANVVELSSVHAVRFARTLKELGDRELRLHVVAMLLDLASADEQIAHAEVNTLRQVTQGLGLTQDDYNRLQSHHKQKLATLREAPPNSDA